MKRSTSDHLQADRSTLWHPYTSLLEPPRDILPVSHAEGCTLVLEDCDGSRLIDPMASWWSVVHGYRHPRLQDALIRQANILPHVMLGGLTHRPAVALGDLLVSILNEAQQQPPHHPSSSSLDASSSSSRRDGLTKVFLADSGSVSIEVALKMALQYQRARGLPDKCKILALTQAYHGDTLHAMSVCDPVNSMHAAFGHQVVPQQYFVTRPPCDPTHTLRREDIKNGEGDDTTSMRCHGCNCQPSYEQAFAQACQDLQETLQQHSHRLAAMIVEPVVQGAGGMRFYSPEYLKVARQLTREHNVLLIADEIATGFGRAGDLFCSNGMEPDILTVGKALTGGTMTLAACLATEQVAHGVSRAVEASSSNPSQLQPALPLMHGPTFMGNPLACAVAIESISMLLETNDDENEPMWKRNVQRIEQQLRHELQPAVHLSSVAHVRVKGAIGVLEMKRPLPSVSQRCVELGVWLRPFGRLLYCMPPYVISSHELTQVTHAMLTLAKEAAEA